jgi:hypothetical protein
MMGVEAQYVLELLKQGSAEGWLRYPLLVQVFSPLSSR